MARGVHVIGFPWEEKSTLRRGSQLGPWAIRKYLIAWGFLGGGALADGRIVDEGVVRLPSDETAFQQMEERVERILRAGGAPAVLGGDHTVTLPTLRAVVRRFGPVNLLWVDRHADLQPEFLGDRWSHACVAARLVEAGAVRTMILAGVQDLNSEEERALRRCSAVILREAGGTEIPQLRGPTYVSVDLDVLDPQFAPGASAGLSGGWDPESLSRLLSDLRAPVVGFDVVELNPRLDRGGRTARVAAEAVQILVGKVERSLNRAFTSVPRTSGGEIEV